MFIFDIQKGAVGDIDRGNKTDFIRSVTVNDHQVPFTPPRGGPWKLASVKEYLLLTRLSKTVLWSSYRGFARA